MFIKLDEQIKMNGKTPTVIPDVPPAGDIALHATWKQGASGRKADGTDIIWPGYRGGQLHQGYVLSAVRFHITWRYFDLPHSMWWLMKVEAIELVPTNVDDVRAQIVGTGRREMVRKFTTMHFKVSVVIENGFKKEVMKATIDAKINLVTALDRQKCHQIKYNTDSRKEIQ